MAFIVAALRTRTRMYSMDDLSRKIDNDRSVSCLSLTELNSDADIRRPVSCIYEISVRNDALKGNKRQRPLSTASQLSWWNESYEALNNIRADDIIPNDFNALICHGQSNESLGSYHRYDSIQDKSLRLMRTRHRRNKKRLRKNLNSTNDLSTSSLLLNEEPIAVDYSDHTYLSIEDEHVYEPVEFFPTKPELEKQEQNGVTKPLRLVGATEQSPESDFENEKENSFCSHHEELNDPKPAKPELEKREQNEVTKPLRLIDATNQSTESDLEKENPLIPHQEESNETKNSKCNRHNSIQLKSWQIRRQRRAILNMRRKTERYGSFIPHRQEREL